MLTIRYRLARRTLVKTAGLGLAAARSSSRRDVAHAMGRPKNRHLFWHVTYAFLRMPPGATT